MYVLFQGTKRNGRSCSWSQMRLPRGRGMPPSERAVGRQVFRWSSAQRAVENGAPALSRVLLLAAHGEQPPLPERAAQHVCRACFTLLVPGVEGCTRAQRVAHKHRPAARRHSLRVRCHHCGYENISPTVAPPAARTAIASSADVSSAAPGTSTAKTSSRSVKRGAPPPQPNSRSSKKPRAQPKPKPAAATPTSADTLFGFDFVPLG